MRRAPVQEVRVVCPTCGKDYRRSRRDDSRGAFGICRRDGTALVPRPPAYFKARAAAARRDLGSNR